ncbi:hypothetical protein MMC30_008792 [Trapelia coarctata]|nr:hypothetical protein [Trapelia coarctata]
MAAYGTPLGIDFRFDVEKGKEVANKIINSLYSQYFEQAQHPSSSSTLLTAATAAGVDEAQATAFIDDESEGLQGVKMLIREQAGNGIDAVPYTRIEGKRRDLTLEGAKKIPEYVKALEQVTKDSG